MCVTHIDESCYTYERVMSRRSLGKIELSESAYLATLSLRPTGLYRRALYSLKRALYSLGQDRVE